MFTDKELDELDARFKSAMEDKFDAYNEELNARQKEIERLRAALAKSCEEGRDEMYDCGYNRLRAALERVANSTVLRAREIAREALEAGDE
jgi:phage host-nuclease inhibitor protein Gam